MNRIIVFLVILLMVVAVLALGWWAFTLPGEVTVPVGQEEVRIKAGLAVVGVLFLSALIAAVWWILSGLFVLPGRISRSRR
ncbi:MAG: heme biosynthesis protein HemY, partial [Hyphomonas sp.]|nr:heme biosynthesis protein HemY [Hyphomonas sp.]